MRISCNTLVQRQTPEGRFSHFEGTWDELVALVEANFERVTPGYRDGVMLVPVPADRFRCGVVDVTSETVLKATFVTRRPGEDSYIDVVALGGEKLPAKVVEIVIYRHDVLAADGDASTDAEWEVVSVNARPTEEPEPMTPVAMARNILGRPGGTAATYTAEEFARAIVYWQTRVMRGG